MATSNVELRVDATQAVQALRQVNRASGQADTATQQLTRSVNGTAAAMTKAGRELRTAANGMQYFIDATGRARKENGQFVTTAEAAAAGIQRQARAAQGATNAIRSLASGLASIGAAALVAGMVRGAASAEQLQLRLKMLSKEYGETARLQQFVAQSAATFGQSQVEAAQGVADVYARLRPLGTSLAQIETVYKGFNAVALASGTSAEAASGAFLQLSQALGSGTLQGDEFRSVAEQVPGILRLVANEMGVTVGQLKKLGSEGKITSDILINALAKGFEENGSKIKELLDQSPAQRFKEFQNATQALSNALGSELLPALTPIVSAATELLKQFGSLPGPVKTITAAVVGLTAAVLILAPALSAVGGGLAALGAAKLGAAAAGVGKLALAAVGLKVALLALPWVALAAGITAATAATVNAYQQQAKLNGLLNEGAGSTKELEGKKAELEKRLEAVRNRLEGTHREMAATGRKAAQLRMEAAKLESQLNRLDRTIVIRLKLEKEGFTFDDKGNVQTFEVAGIKYDAKTRRAINPPKTVSQQREAQRLANLNADSKKTSAGGGGRARAGDAERAAKAAADELARVNGIVRERKAEAEVMMLREGMADRISAAEAAGDRALQIRLQGEQRALDIQYKYAQELARENDTRAQRAIIDQGIAELYINQNQTQRELAEFQRQADQDRLNALQKAIELQYEQNTAIQQQKQLADSVAATIGQGMTSAFDALINGAQSWEKSLQQIASGVLVDIANQLIRIYVIEQAINAIKSFLTPFSASTPIGAGGGMVGKFGTLGPNYGIPQRAMGGSVTSGKPYLVGEKGPELFMPGRSGGIAPTGSFGGGVNVVVNVDASGTSVAGNEPDAAQLGRAVSVAVQAEIIKQQRPGGLLSTTRR